MRSFPLLMVMVNIALFIILGVEPSPFQIDGIILTVCALSSLYWLWRFFKEEEEDV